jgi:hypothetical protein
MRRGRVRQGKAGHGAVRLGIGLAGLGGARHGEAGICFIRFRHGMARLGWVRLGRVGPGAAGHGMAWQGRDILFDCIESTARQEATR